MRKLSLPFVAFTIFVPPLFSHPQPTTLIVLDVGAREVSMSLHLPLNELELAFGHGVDNLPEQRLPEWETAFRDYLASHIRPATSSGEPWTVRILDMTYEGVPLTAAASGEQLFLMVFGTGCRSTARAATRSRSTSSRRAEACLGQASVFGRSSGPEGTRIRPTCCC